MSDDSGYSEQEDIQDMIDRAVERDGPTYVRENIGRLLAGVNVVMNIDKAALEIPTATDAALNRWEPSTGVEPTVARAQTRRVAEHLSSTGERVTQSDLVDRLAGESTLDAVTWWEQAVEPSLQYFIGESLIVYYDADHTYQWDASEVEF